jgi:3-oxoacyl-[acyl-carrier protein] reductase
MDIRLDGKAAFITGGSEGLGKAMAIKFADAGADIAILARSRDKLDAAKAEIEAAGGGKVCALPCDLLDGAATKAAFAEAEGALGKIDILVNNAGTSRALPFLDITEEQWQEDFELKLFAAVRLVRLALPAMKERRWGRIINVLNTGAKAPPAGGAPTAVSRAAGLALTKVLAGECAPHNVLVNALLVGLIKSGQWERLHPQRKPDLSYEDFLQDMVNSRNIPIGRIGEAEEFANIACFLASDASGYISGTAINVDGGRSPVV